MQNSLSLAITQFRRIAGGGGGPPQTAIAGNPLDSQVYTVNDVMPLSATAPADTTLQWWAGATYGSATLQSTLTPGALHTFTGTYTVPATAQNLVGYFKGDVSGAGPAINIIVDKANDLASRNANSLSPTNVTATVTTTPSPHPMYPSEFFYKVQASATGSARRWLIPTPGSAQGTKVNCNGAEITFEVPPGCTMPVLYLQQGNFQLWANLLTRETNCGGGYARFVEYGPSPVNNGYMRGRIQFRSLDKAAAPGTTFYLQFQPSIDSADTWSCADTTNAFVLLAAIRTVNYIKMPFNEFGDKFGAYENSNGTPFSWTFPAQYLAQPGPPPTTGVRCFKYKWGHGNATENEMASGVGGQRIGIILPTGYDSSKTYPLLFVPQALYESTENGSATFAASAIESALINGYANRYSSNRCTGTGCIVVTYDEYNGGFWGGIFADGHGNFRDFFPDVLLPWLRKMFSVSTSPEDIMGYAYSKAWWYLLGLRIARPDVIRYVGGWDGPLNGNGGAWTNNNTSLSFNAQADYDAWDPVQQLVTKSAVLTGYKNNNGTARKCLRIDGGFTFQTELASFTSALTGYGIPYNSVSNLTTQHALGPNGYNTSYIEAALDDLWAMKNASF